jgi:hypothetical protein
MQRKSSNEAEIRKLFFEKLHKKMYSNSTPILEEAGKSSEEADAFESRIYFLYSLCFYEPYFTIKDEILNVDLIRGI